MDFVGRGMQFRMRKFMIAITVLTVSAIGPFSLTNAEAGVYRIAKSYIGLHEKKHTKRLSKSLGINPRRTPWCGAFVGTVVKRAGKKVPNGYMRAASWKGVGKSVKLKHAKAGDVVVVRTKHGHHVGIYHGQKKGRVLLLGGNQSNQVKVSGYRIGSIQAIRRL
jgi:uncharacterized protein (TIGR02594 family)